MNDRDKSLTAAAAKKKVLIVGAGIGGLATAIALRQAGFEVDVYEDAAALRGIGAGISLWSNATAVLDKLGLLQETLDKSAVFTRLEIRDERGARLTRAEIGKYVPPAVCIHRADLIDLLQRHCASQTIHLSKTFERFEQTDADVAAFFADGTRATGDVLIGADGINSRVRAQIKGDAKPIYRGYVIWRGTVEFETKDFDASCPIETWGAGKRFGLVPLGKNRFYWYAARNQPEGKTLRAAERKTQLLKFFHDWHAPVPQIIEATTAENILHNDCYDRPPEPDWSTGRVCLIGDAAHATTPSMGQGGCLALEDALVLSRCLQNASSGADAFWEFERLRFPERNLSIGALCSSGASGSGKTRSPSDCETF
jgi:2-polyprenyl-6-methoxyphenol hydroxylase-like FAD-dependent oxidoreductase